MCSIVILTRMGISKCRAKIVNKILLQLVKIFPDFHAYIRSLRVFVRALKQTVT
jgi:hypothetical protein